jgi:hypothetical protein
MRNRGRDILLLNIGLVLVATMAMIAVHVFAETGEPFYQHAVRLILTVGLCAWLYRGSPVARWIAIVVFGGAGLLGLINFLSGSFAAFVMAVCSVAYLSLAIVSAASSETKVFLQQQRAVANDSL